MSTSRRTFLITSGVAATGGVAAASALPAVAATGAPARSTATPDAVAGPLVAYVSDVASGQVTVMRGDDEVVVTDHELARRIAGAVG